MSMVAFLVSFLASTAGAICGIGGGVIIKPVLDLFQMASVSTISFLSGCTVLSMSCTLLGERRRPVIVLWISKQGRVGIGSGSRRRFRQTAVYCC